MSTIDDKAAALLERPSLEGLSYALRHPEIWPKGFEWNYDHCCTCAMGLAGNLWGQIRAPCTDEMCKTMPLTRTEARDIFTRLALYVDGVIASEHVADAIDALLASRANTHTGDYHAENPRTRRCLHRPGRAA